MSDERPRASSGLKQIFDHARDPYPILWLSLGFVLFMLSLPLLSEAGRNFLETNAKEIGDVGVVALGLLGLTLAVWRFGFEGRSASASERLAQAGDEQAKAAERQAEVAERQLATALQQSATAERQTEAATIQADAAGKQAEAAHQRASIDDQALLHDRYQGAARMLGNGVQAVRIAGVYLLDRLSREQPEAYHVEAMRLFASFVRHQDSTPTGDSRAGYGSLRADVQAVMVAIGSRDDSQRECERKRRFVLDLTGANLQGASLRDSDLRSVNLERVSLEGADLAGARLDGARVGGAVLVAPGAPPVRGLVQEQLDSCSGGTLDAPMGLELLGLTWRRTTR